MKKTKTVMLRETVIFGSLINSKWRQMLMLSLSKYMRCMNKGSSMDGAKSTVLVRNTFSRK